MHRHYRSLEKNIVKTLRKVLDEDQYVLGKAVGRFESDFASFCHKKYCVGVNSGTDALECALRAYGIGVGDEVITVANSFFSTAMSISNVGAYPRFIDCTADSYTLDISLLPKVITKKTKAILPVHLFGQSADMDPILSFAKKYNLVVIEDCAQAHGARYKNQPVPIGETGAFSFYPTKNLGALGDAGAIVTNNPRVKGTCELLRNNGSIQKYIHTIVGMNSRLDTIQAAILSMKLPYLPKFIRDRQKRAKLYRTLLSDIPKLSLPKEMEYAYHVYHLFVIECDRRDQLQKYLDNHGATTIIHYPIPIHLQKPYVKLKYRNGDFPVSERSAKRMLSLPIYPELSVNDIRYVSSLIHKFFKHHQV